jgi:cephalosporin hydroxylase
MQLIQAMATDRARRVNTKYGERTVIDAIRRDNGEKVTIWRGGNDEYSIKHVITNARLTLTLDSKGKYSLVEDTNLINLGQPLPELPVAVNLVSRHLASIDILAAVKRTAIPHHATFLRWSRQRG